MNTFGPYYLSSVKSGSINVAQQKLAPLRIGIKMGDKVMFI